MFFSFFSADRKRAYKLLAQGTFEDKETIRKQLSTWGRNCGQFTRKIDEFTRKNAEFTNSEIVRKFRAIGINCIQGMVIYILGLLKSFI
jgi:hypothetical protein